MLSMLSSRTLHHSRHLLCRPSTIRLMSAAAQSYNTILISRPDPAVALVTLNRPKALNALNLELINELLAALKEADADDNVSAIVITGSERAFAAGADIKEMKDKQFSDTYKNRFLENWQDITAIRKPIIAAVSGYALGGGCELALACDITLASPTATFGQPEINIGVIPGGGGSQRLTQAVGKSRSMELTLTGRNFSAEEAERWGVVSSIHEDVVGAAVKIAQSIASKSKIAVQAGKEAVNAAYELPLNQGLRFERRLFQSMFATHDQKEGMGAFAEKRKPNFTDN